MFSGNVDLFSEETDLFFKNVVLFSEKTDLFFGKADSFLIKLVNQLPKTA
jgi:hypothetical protein